MLIGYARTSTMDQVAGLEAQEAALVATGCTKLFAEQASSVALWNSCGVPGIPPRCPRNCVPSRSVGARPRIP